MGFAGVVIELCAGVSWVANVSLTRRSCAGRQATQGAKRISVPHGRQ